MTTVWRLLVVALFFGHQFVDAQSEEDAWNIWRRYLETALSLQDKGSSSSSSATTASGRRSLQNNNAAACGEVVDEIFASDLRDLFDTLVQTTLNLVGTELALFQFVVLPQVTFGVRIQKVCGRCSEFPSGTTTCLPDEYGYNALHSGLLITPLDRTSNQIKPGTSPINIVCHGTQSGNHNVPSNQWSRTTPDPQVILAVLLSSVSGSYAILPDYLGYGESTDYFRPYIVKQAYPCAVWPLLHRAEEIIAQETDCASALADSITVMGYSEGGYAAVAVADAMYREGKTILSVNAGGGPYRLSSVQIAFLWNQILQGTFISSRRYYLALLGVVYSETTTDALNYGSGQNMLASSVRDNIVDVVHSNVGQSGINAEIPVNDPFAIFDQTVVDDLTAAILRGEAEPCVTSAVVGETDILCEALQANDLVDVLESAPYLVSLCHSVDDTLVSYDNLPNMDANRNLRLESVTGPHSNAALACFLPIIQYFLNDANTD